MIAMLQTEGSIRYTSLHPLGFTLCLHPLPPCSRALVVMGLL